MDLNLLYSALVGAGFPSIACIVLCWLVWRQNTSDSAARKRDEEDLRKVKDKVNSLETEKISRLETRLEEHIKEDKSIELLTEMKHVNGNLEKLTAQVSRALETNAGQSKDIENNKQYISNLREDLQAHIRECRRR